MKKVIRGGGSCRFWIEIAGRELLPLKINALHDASIREGRAALLLQNKGMHHRDYAFDIYEREVVAIASWFDFLMDWLHLPF
ncbi:MAG: hypothetical protein NXI22_08850 [bacterium]|nr:hypothetical protein [bacterium]